MDNSRDNTIKAAVCIDFGDGTSTAHAIGFDSANVYKFNPIPLKLNKKDVEIESAICYRRNCDVDINKAVKDGLAKRSEIVLECYKKGYIDIGYQSVQSESDVCVTNFKKCPPSFGVESWDTQSLIMNSETTFEDNMIDFISILWKNIYDQYCVDDGVLKGLSSDEIAIYVGCPASQKWDKEKYKELIQKATGMPNVVVATESTAGICRTIREFATDVNLLARIAIIDIGSSTLDFTCVENGRIIEERSWTLGAGKIEENMFCKIFDALIAKEEEKLNMIPYVDETTPKATADYLLKQKNEILERINEYEEIRKNSTPNGTELLEIRKNAKEVYFDRRKKDESKPFKYSFFDKGSVEINDDFMYDAVYRMPIFNVSENGNTQQPVQSDDKSWFGYCKAILEKIQSESFKDDPVRVIVTGGASKMYFIRQLCETVFKKNLGEAYKIVDDPAPQNCVSYGLCQVAVNDIKAPEVLKTKLDYMLTDKTQYDVSCLYHDIFTYIVNICMIILQ